MSVFVLCSAASAAALAVSFEVGRVCEQRQFGISKVSLPFQEIDWMSENAKTVAGVFVALLSIELAFLPKVWNPFLYFLTANWAGESSREFSSLLAFTLFGSWSCILAIGCGGIATSFKAIMTERQVLESEKLDHENSVKEIEQQLEEDELWVLREKRSAVASAAAAAGEWKKLKAAQAEHNTAVLRSENERIWSKALTKEFDKKTIHVVDNAIDKRWREVEGQGLNLEEMRKRNKEKEKMIREQRARRAEREKTEHTVMESEKTKLRKLTDELEGLKETMEKLKEENMRKEQEKIQELKDRELALKEKEEFMLQTHQKKLEKLKEKEIVLNEKEERFESGEERRKLQEMSEKLESSKLNVAKFREDVMIREKEKREEFDRRESELKMKEEELKAAATSIKQEKQRISYSMEALITTASSEEDMPDDEASARSHRTTDKTTSLLNQYEEEGSDDESGFEENDLPTIMETGSSDSKHGDLESEEVEMVEREIISKSEEKIDDQSPVQETECKENPEEAQKKKESKNAVQYEVARDSIEEQHESSQEQHSPVDTSVEPTSLMDLEQDGDDDASIASIDRPFDGVNLEAVNEEIQQEDENDHAPFIDKCGSDKSLLDTTDNDEDNQDCLEEDIAVDIAEDIEEDVEEDLGEDVNDESRCMINVNNVYEAFATKKAGERPGVLAEEFLGANDLDADDIQDSLLDSDNDSLSYQIQHDIQAAQEQRGEAMDPEDTSIATTDAVSTYDDAESSPLQERADVATTNGNSAAARNELSLQTMDAVASGVAALFKNAGPVSPRSPTTLFSKAPMSPRSPTAFFPNAVPLSPKSPATNNETSACEYESEISVVATDSSDGGYVVLKNDEMEDCKENESFGVTTPRTTNGKETFAFSSEDNDDSCSTVATTKTAKSIKDNKKSLVVSEEAGVEVIAWMEPCSN
mmetsp:Transcript_26321/g.54274  ORF Transcript_26321/g.54274 Transcript_26321/m.54274 type:complete len:932 (+) Transcript_26321:189-2984(+)|eukprot:CAMPEP_0201147930 /NCGR_PEP_ID=MMETSP0851-20130426/9445_1 /ASSEMBLY_ACC=CAM_ASM_000631 /TAXON_ID=183588 /ORGANISM="Pseudo-nitzschia fraudulenta, Strain WWA7" /LENGTH=931 /DNA_ID=CAMNT_0047423933 /DNA_START=182 /DNA_END=2977 /DNA_ORIENTATION=-